MVQLGFVIDHSRCIGCHACTVACKSENDVPIGDFRTWVKYTEEGAFPQVKRSFAVLRCNQCSEPPCVDICPVNALEKREKDGIVDIDPEACIGCKGCMQACPYDALYINDLTGTAEKCHFCAHRTEIGLAPACAVVCPTEAIVPGDFDDAQSRVSQLRDAGGLSARKIEAGTRPNVLYKEVGEAGIDPLLTQASGSSIWADRHPAVNAAVEGFRADEGMTRSRTVYDVGHKPMWGDKVVGYLFAKSIAAGAFLAALPFTPANKAEALLWPLVGLIALAATTALLVLDLKRPERFLTILTRPNWSSWLVKGAYVLMGYGAALLLWLAMALFEWTPVGPPKLAFQGVAALFAALTACYTAWLFGQAKGRVLWLKRGLALQLLAQAVLAGACLRLIVAPLLDQDGAGARWLLAGALAVHAVFALIEGAMAPRGREAEFAQVVALIKRGPYARVHWGLGLGLGHALPLLLLVISGGSVVGAVAGGLALLGLYFEEDVLVRAGQALPIS